MRFQYELTYEEYVETLHANARSSGDVSRTPWLVGAGAVAVGIALLVASEGGVAMVAPLLVISLGAFIGIHPLNHYHRGLRRYWERHRRGPASFAVEAVDEHISWDSSLTRYQVQWAAFERAIETRRLFLLKRPNGELLPIPKRAFESSEALAEFRALLATKFPERAKGFPVV